MLDELALSRAEYEAIADRLGRLPDPLELGLFGSLWSEHCGYKHTKRLIKTLPSHSDRLLVAPGAENAGVIDIGDGLAIAMKIESHNHPSAVEPFEGAATGVGGIVRDIFAMGARPVALLNSLRFGRPEESRNRFLLHGVVAGISAYGNCIGVPDVGGEIVFDDSYADNPLVNAMCVGLIEDGRVLSASARSPGDLLILVGADTGRDGIHGASGLASRTFEEEQEMRSAVQVGNPFLEKVLIEACLEAVQLDCVVGMQDLGAAGLASAAIEMASRSGMGLRLDVAKVPRRETGMTPYEVMLSESQERMLLAVRPGAERDIADLFSKWDLDSTVIGEFTDGKTVLINDGPVEATESPVHALTDAPEYVLSGKKPDWLDRVQNEDPAGLPLPDASPDEVLLRMLASPNIASKRAVFRQYDHQVQNNTVIPPGGDAALLRLKDTRKAIAVSVDCNGRLCYLDPYAGSMIAVAEACRNVSCTGADPVALTDGLNFGNPETNDVQYQLTESIRGIRAAALAFGVPIVSGNASLYNESRGRAIFPTPMIGALGLLDDVSRRAAAGFKRERDLVAVIGANEPWDTVGGLMGSEMAYVLHDWIGGQPAIDLSLEVRVQAFCRDSIGNGLINSAHDCSQGGIAVTIAESAIIGGQGVTIPAAFTGRWDACLFGETQSRIVVTVDTAKVGELLDMAGQHNVPVCVLGSVGGDRLKMGGELDVGLKEAALAWNSGFEAATSS